MNWVRGWVKTSCVTAQRCEHCGERKKIVWRYFERPAVATKVICDSCADELVDPDELAPLPIVHTHEP